MLYVIKKIIIYIKYKNKYINIFNTHLNNDTPIFCMNKNMIPEIKRNQLNEYLKFVYNKLYNTNININILTGDFNLDYKSKFYNIFIRNWEI